MNEKDLLIVSCFGDSITESMAMEEGDRYPQVLNALLGDKYRVYNGGDGGEKTITIMARQGAVELYTAGDITFSENEAKVHIGNGDGNGFALEDGRQIQLTETLGREIPVNNILIDNKEYRIILENFNWDDGGSCEVYLERFDDIGTAFTIAKGTKVKLASVDFTADNYCQIFLMGANGGYDNNIDTLISQHKQLISRRKDKKYLIIVPHWTNDYNEAFISAFGDRAVNFREAAVNGGLEKLGLTATETDSELIAKNRIPATFLYQNNPDDVHLSKHGYKLLATVLYERGVELGYWE